MPNINKINYKGTEYDLYGLGGDVLPVGTELEIGTNTNIPIGWQLVDDREKLVQVTDGYYIEHNNGLVDLYLLKTVSVNVNSKWTDNCYYGVIPTISFPDVFDNIINFQISMNTTSSKGCYLGYYDTSSVTKSGITGLNLLRPSSNDNVSVVLSIHIVGTKTISSGKRIKKIYQTVPPAMLDEYITEEQVVGTYLGKPLYRKVYSITTPSTADATNIIDITDLDLEYLVYDYFAIKYPDNITTSSNNDNAILYLRLNWQNRKYITMAVRNEVYRGKQAYVIIEYTKTTDNGGV